MRYSEGFKASIVKKTQGGSGQSLYRIARGTEINKSTIKNRIAQYKNGRLGLDGNDSISPSERSPGEKLALLLESRTITEDVNGEWHRMHGLHSEHLPLWEQELASIVLTRNLEFSKWGTIFTDDQMAAAIIGRLAHHGHIVLFEGESYRMKHALIRQREEEKLPTS